MKNKVLIAIIIIFLAIAVGGGTYLYLNLSKAKKENKRAEEKVAELEKEIKELKDSKKEKAEEEKAAAETVQKATEEKSQSGQTVVTKPLDDETIGNPVTIAGRAIAFESQVNIRIKDANGKVLKEAYTTTDAKDAGEFGNFSVSVGYSAPATSTGMIEVYQVSMADGSDSEKDKVTISVKFK